MKEFKCYYIEDGNMQDEIIYAKTEKNARDKMRRKGRQCKAILEQLEVEINISQITGALMQCGVEKAVVGFVADALEKYV